MKKITLLASFFAFVGIGIFVAHPLVARNEVIPYNPKIGPSVYMMLAKQQSRSVQKAGIPILVILKDQADLSQIDQSLAKEVKGQQVYSLLTSHANQTQADLRAYLTAQGLKFRPFWIVNMVVLETATADQIQTLAKRDDVAKIVGDPSVKAKPLPVRDLARSLMNTDGNEAAGDNIVATNATQVWSEFGTRGAGIVVAGQDTGVEYTHPALLKHYRGYNGDAEPTNDYNWHDAFQQKLPETASNRCGYALAKPCDDDDHGTHTMGTMIGDDGAGNTIGMAPDAKWIACRNMDAGTGAPSSYLDCFQFMLAPTPIGGDSFTSGDATKAPHVINNSWGCPADEGCEGSEMVPALKAMQAAGIFVVVSAGNDGPGCSTIDAQPATITGASFTVGAFNHRTKVMADFSSRGPSPLDGGVGPVVVAPGVSIRSSVPGGQYAQAMWSGTSMAGPHVAGEVALIWAVVPKLIGHVKETAQIIESTAKPISVPKESCGNVSGTAVPNNTSGYGLIDVYAAVKKAKSVYGK